MNKIVIVLAFLLFPAISQAASVRGYWKDTNHDGVKDTYVQPYERSNPNSTRTDNYSYPGNLNPNSGLITPQSTSPRETYPTNPNPFEQKKGW